MKQSFCFLVLQKMYQPNTGLIHQDYEAPNIYYSRQHRLIWRGRKTRSGSRIESRRKFDLLPSLFGWFFLWQRRVPGFGPTFAFPPSVPRSTSLTQGTKAKVSEGRGCDAGLEGVDPLGGPDRGPSPFFFFSNPLSEEWEREREPTI